MHELTDSFVSKSWQLIVRELIASDGELGEDASVRILLGAAGELSHGLLSEKGCGLSGLLLLALVDEGVSSKESFHLKLVWQVLLKMILNNYYRL